LFRVAVFEIREGPVAGGARKKLRAERRQYLDLVTKGAGTAEPCTGGGVDERIVIADGLRAGRARRSIADESHIRC
jgi:hypothetical protein